MSIGADDAVMLGFALQAANVAANQVAANRVAHERSARISEEEQRQAQFGDQARALLDQSTAGFDPGAQALSKDSIAHRYQQAVTPGGVQTPASPAPDYGTTPGAPAEVKSDQARQLGRAMKLGREHAKASAALNANSVLQQRNQFGLGRLGQDLGRLGDYSSGSGSVLPYELMSANTAGNDIKMAGDVAGGAGDISMAYGLTRRPPKNQRRGYDPELDDMIDTHRSLASGYGMAR